MAAFGHYPDASIGDDTGRIPKAEEMPNRTSRSRYRRRLLLGSRIAAIGALLVAVSTGAACGGTSAATDGGSSPSAWPTTSTPELGEVVTAPAETAGEVLELEGVDPVTGETVRLSDFAGKPIVLNFWASWCPPCREELPALIELARKHPEIQIVGVNLQDAASNARALQEQIGFDWPSIADRDGKISQRLAVVGMPTTFFLDAEHRITGQVVGGTDLAGFEQGLRLTAANGEQ